MKTISSIQCEDSERCVPSANVQIERIASLFESSKSNKMNKCLRYLVMCNQSVLVRKFRWCSCNFIDEKRHCFAALSRSRDTESSSYLQNQPRSLFHNN